MILVLGGTEDSRILTELILEKDYPVCFSTFSEYGNSLASGLKNANLVWGPLDIEKLTNLIAKYKIKIIVDATHPYAINISQLAIEVAQTNKISYLRYERNLFDSIENPLIHYVDNLEEAAKQILVLGKRVLSTIGSKQIPKLVKEVDTSKIELFVRILPDRASLEGCLNSGISPKNIIAMQGPFSQELNETILMDYQIDVLLTKDSGVIGGTDTKIRAALNRVIPVVIIKRPQITYPVVATDFHQILKKLGDLQC